MKKGTILVIIIWVFLIVSSTISNSKETQHLKLWKELNRNRIQYEHIRERMIRLMFRISELKYEDEAELTIRIKQSQRDLLNLVLTDMAEQRSIINRLHTDTRKLEIYQLADGILCSTKGDLDIAYKLTALAWQETHFVNRRGQDGEIGFFQFLPSTVEEVLKVHDKELKKILKELENNQCKAAEFAWLLLKGFDIKKGIGSYNHGAQYPGVYFDKLERVKKELLRRDRYDNY